MILLLPFSGFCKFIRVYNLQGKLIASGNYTLVNDTALKLYEQGRPVYLKPERIGKIAVGHLGSHDVAVGALVGAVSIGLISLTVAHDGAEYASDGTTGGGFLAGAMAGAAAGAVIGGIAAISKDYVAYDINGSMDHLKEFQNAMRKKKTSTD